MPTLARLLRLASPLQRRGHAERSEHLPHRQAIAREIAQETKLGLAHLAELRRAGGTKSIPVRIAWLPNPWSEAYQRFPLSFTRPPMTVSLPDADAAAPRKRMGSPTDDSAFSRRQEVQGVTRTQRHKKTVVCFAGRS